MDTFWTPSGQSQNGHLLDMIVYFGSKIDNVCPQLVVRLLYSSCPVFPKEVYFMSNVQCCPFRPLVHVVQFTSGICPRVYPLPTSHSCVIDCMVASTIQCYRNVSRLVSHPYLTGGLVACAMIGCASDFRSQQREVTYIGYLYSNDWQVLYVILLQHRAEFCLPYNTFCD